MIRSFFREPLVWFLFGGVFFFLLLKMADPLDGDTIIFDDADIISYLQYRSKAFDENAAREAWKAMDEQGRAQIEADYTRDEILYREALKLGLDTNDEVVRRRIIQKMDYVLAGFASLKEEVSEEALRQYYRDNISNYKRGALISFSHWFFDRRKNGIEDAGKRAAAALNFLSHNQKEELPSGSDRFFFQKNYVEQSFGTIESHFGSEFAASVFNEELPLRQWTMPIQSEYGVHLVFVHSLLPSGTLSFEEVAPRVLIDYRRELNGDMRKIAYEKIKSTYHISRVEK